MALTKINNNTLSAVTGLPAGVGGKVLQVVQTTDTVMTSVTANQTFTDIISVNITPSSSSNKILVIPNLKLGVSGNINNHVACRLERGGSAIHVNTNSSFNSSTNTLATWGDYQNDSANSGWKTTGMTIFSESFLDSPSSTSQVTYTVAVWTQGNSSMFLNRCSVNNADQTMTGASSLTVMEIAG